mgnify:CR=1 FL=1
MQLGIVRDRANARGMRERRPSPVHVFQEYGPWMRGWTRVENFGTHRTVGKIHTYYLIPEEVYTYITITVTLR